MTARQLIRAWALLLPLAAAAPATADPWIDFNSVGAQPNYMWVDTSVAFKDNFYTLRNDGVSQASWTNVRTHEGAGAVFAGFNSDNRGPTPNQNFWGASDALFLTVSGDFTLGAWTGFVAYVYVESVNGSNGNPAYPLFCKLYFKGTGYVWYNGATTPIPRDQWTKITVDFNAAYDSNGTGPMVVPLGSLTDVHEIGVQLVGGDYDRGVTPIFVDSIQLGRPGQMGDDQTAPPIPGSLSASNAGSGNQVNLSWSAPGASDLDHYNVYRSTSSGFAVTPVTRLKSLTGFGTSYQDVSVVDGLTYRYRVTAVDKSGNESAPTSEASATPSGPGSFDLPNKGMTYVAWSTGAYNSVDSMSSLDDLMSTGADWVALIVTQYMPSFNATTISADPFKTPTDAAVVKAIQDIHARGMKVLLKPHVDVNDGSWRGAIHPTNAASWFSSYASMINNYATMAQDNGVEMLCIGTEFKTMSDNKFWGTTARTTDWAGIISGVRARYSGPLTYAANTGHPQDEFATIEFWNLLDFVGLNAWWKLTSKPNPTLDDLKAGWSNSYDMGEALAGKAHVFNPLQSAADWRSWTGKQVVITELGSVSAEGTGMAPANYSNLAPATALGLQEQADMYTAGFAAWNHRSWVRGLFWWHWDPNPNGGGRYSNYYVPNDKPALQVLTQTYGGENTGANFRYTFETSTQEWTADGTVFFKDNLGAPSLSGVSPHGGASVLAYPLSFDDPASGEIGDFAYVEPHIRKDLSSYKGLKLHVKVPDGAVTAEGGNPLKASVVLQTGPNYEWFESNTSRYLSSGQWREVSIDFSSAKKGTGELGQAVTNLHDVRRIGISLFGGGATNGSSVFYVDDVVARATYTVLGLSLSTTDYFIPAASPLGSTITATSIDFENTGNTQVLYKLRTSGAAPVGWTPSATNPGPGQFVLNAMFNAGQPANFVETNHALTGSDQTSGPGKFNGSQLGSGVQAGDVRNLWLEFRAPSVQSPADIQRQNITLSITAEVQ